MVRIPAYLGLLLMLATGTLVAQYGSATNQVTVNVNAITQVRVIGGAVNLSITDAIVVAGQNTMTVTNTATQLQWGVNSGLRKITAQTSLAAPLFVLRLLGTSPTAGNAAAEVTLSTTAADLMVNIGRSLGTCTLRYTGVALATQGTGNDVHTITFTVTVQ